MDFMTAHPFGSVRTLLISALLAATSCIVSCSKDDGDTASLQFDAAVLFVEGAGQSASIGFTARDVTGLEVSSTPEGWSASIDAAAAALRVTAPPADDQTADEKGTVTIKGTSLAGTSMSASVEVSVAPTIDLTARQSNCYVVNRPNHRYRFDATRIGEGSERIATESVAVLWKTNATGPQYLKLDDNGMATFFIGTNDNGEIVNANAVIAAYDAKGVILWSWHFWITDFDPEAEPVLLGGRTFMARNLGAYANESSTTGKVLESFGLYYQWGRKDPFIGPASYNGATDAYLYNGNNSRTYVSCWETTAEIGTVEYTIQNPLIFLRGAEDSAYDWLYAARNNNLWAGAGSTKSLYDPCPRGWQVPDGNAFAGLTIADPLTGGEEYARQYGWHLSDGVNEAFFIGGGRRTYLYGQLQNLNTSDIRPLPWVGFYWTAATTGSDASSMYFTLDTDDAAASTIETAVAHKRANGMSVRCVKAN